MIRKNKWKLIISSIIILLPMLLGLLAEKFLPDEIAVHWGMSGKADGFMNSSLIFIILPLIMLAIHWLCMILTAIINKNAEQNKRLMGMTFWIIPFITLTSCGTIFSNALGYTSNVLTFVYIVIAVSFIFIGNYLPKTTRNLTMGIKIKWTLSNDENWNATHRFGGKVFVAAGFLSLVGILLPKESVFVILSVIILLCVILPCVYSYRFYKKQIAEGGATEEDYKKTYKEVVKNPKLAYIITIVTVAVLGVVLSVVMFTGSIETTLGDTSLTVRASFWEDLTLNYADIESVEYREEGVDGSRIAGFGSARLLLGGFQNDELGAYTRYTYTGDGACVVIKTNGRAIVIGDSDGQSAKAVYDRIFLEISN